MPNRNHRPESGLINHCSNAEKDSTCSKLCHLLQLFLSLGRCNGFWEFNGERQDIPEFRERKNKTGHQHDKNLKTRCETIRDIKTKLRCSVFGALCLVWPHLTSPSPVGKANLNTAAERSENTTVTIGINMLTHPVFPSESRRYKHVETEN